MGKLLVAPLIFAGLICIASADYRMPVGWADGSTQQDHITRELTYLQRNLALTPEQLIQVKDAMEAVVHGTATKTVEQVLQEVCTHAQFAAWWQMKLGSERFNAAEMAAAATDEVDKTVFLSAKQRHQVEAAFFQIELADRIFHYSAHTNVELETHHTDIAVARENALEKILTPAQIEKRTRIAQAEITKPLPNMPELSLTAILPLNRYGWNSDDAVP